VGICVAEPDPAPRRDGAAALRPWDRRVEHGPPV
jgi:hypothetical protein